jgi:hypothetical protein
MDKLEELLRQRIDVINQTYNSPEKEIRIKEVKLILLHVSMENLNNLCDERNG